MLPGIPLTPFQEEALMNLVSLSEDDLSQANETFTQFHSRYTPFFKVGTRSVSESAQEYLQGQLITNQRNNILQYCREVPDSEYQAMQYFISESPWQEEALLGQLRQDVWQWLGDPMEGALLLDESGIPKQGKLSVGVQRQDWGLSAARQGGWARWTIVRGEFTLPTAIRPTAP